MTSLSRDPSRLSLPGIKGDARSENGESLYKSEKPSGIPLPTARTGNGTPVNPSPASSSKPSPGVRSKPLALVQHRFLSPAEWARVAHGVGAIKEAETHQVVHPTCWYWPPKGLPQGLYRDVITQRAKYFLLYHVLNTLRWFLMILQIVLGAVLTALGSFQINDGTAITVLAAVNTVDAGLLALLHNSGLPDRYRLDKVEFTRVEDSLKVCLLFSYMCVCVCVGSYIILCLEA